MKNFVEKPRIARIAGLRLLSEESTNRGASSPDWTQKLATGDLVASLLGEHHLLQGEHPAAYNLPVDQDVNPIRADSHRRRVQVVDVLAVVDSEAGPRVS
jgi:hypothetical protein